MTILRDSRGRWLPGTSSPNEAGKPRGPTQVTKLREQLIGGAAGVLKAMYDRAIGGDARAAALILERTMPTLRAVDLPLAQPLHQLGSITETGRGVVLQMADGDLSPDVGNALLAALGQLARIEETDQVLARLEAIERRLAGEDGAGDESESQHGDDPS